MVGLSSVCVVQVNETKCARSPRGLTRLNKPLVKRELFLQPLHVYDRLSAHIKNFHLPLATSFLYKQQDFLFEKYFSFQ